MGGASSRSVGDEHEEEGEVADGARGRGWRRRSGRQGGKPGDPAESGQQQRRKRSWNPFRRKRSANDASAAGAATAETLRGAGEATVADGSARGTAGDWEGEEVGQDVGSFPAVYEGQQLLCRDKFKSKKTGKDTYKWRECQIVAVESSGGGGGEAAGAGMPKGRRARVHFHEWSSKYDIWLTLETEWDRLAPHGVMDNEQARKGWPLDDRQQAYVWEYLQTLPEDDAVYGEEGEGGGGGATGDQTACSSSSARQRPNAADVYHIGQEVDVQDFYRSKTSGHLTSKFRPAVVVGLRASLVKISYDGWDERWDEFIDLSREASRVAPRGTHTGEGATKAESRGGAEDSVAATRMRMSATTTTSREADEEGRIERSNSYWDLMAWTSGSNRSAPTEANGDSTSSSSRGTLDQHQQRRQQQQEHQRSERGTERHARANQRRSFPPPSRSSGHEGRASPFGEAQAGATGKPSSRSARGAGRRGVDGGRGGSGRERTDRSRSIQHGTSFSVSNTSSSLGYGGGVSESQFRRRLAQLRLRITEVEADGNCLFRAVSHQMFCTEDRHMELRSRCADHMLKHRERFAVFCAGNFDRYIRHIREPCVWGDDLEIRALEELFDRPIEIYSADAKNLKMQTHFDEDTLLPGVVPIKLSYHGQSHYNSIEDARHPIPLPVLRSKVLLTMRTRMYTNSGRK